MQTKCWAVKTPTPPESMLFQCWMLNMAIIGVALPGPPYISSQASIRRQRWLWGVSGRPSLFQSRRCVSLGQVLKDGGMPVSRLAFGPQVVIYAWTDCSPQSQEWWHLRAEKRDRVRPCLQRPCRWALHVIQRSCIPQWFQVGFKNLLPLLF